MNKKASIFVLIIISSLALSACNDETDIHLNNKQLLEIKENIKYDKELDTLIELAQKEDIEDVVDTSMIKKILNNYQDKEGKAVKQDDIYLDHNYYNNPHYVDGPNTNKIQKYGLEWSIYQVKNVDDLVSTTMLMNKFSRQELSMNDIEEKVAKLTESIFEENGSPFYSVNPGINLQKDNSKLSEMIKDLQDENKKDQVNLHALQSGLEANRASFMFEGDDFYLIYVVYNDVMNSNVEVALSYVSKKSYHHNDWIKSLVIDELEDGIREYKGYFDLPISYAEPDGRIIKFKNDKQMTDEERDQLKYTLYGGQKEEEVSNESIREEKKDVKEWIEDEMENRAKIQEIQREQLEEDEYE